MTEMTGVTERVVRQSFLGLLEGLLSLLMIGMVLWFPASYLGAHLCAFGECSTPGPEEIGRYRAAVGAFAGLVVATVVVARRRGARWSFAWHAVVAVVGAASALAFAMPSVDWRDLLTEDPAPPTSPGVPPCHSGPPNDCAGG